MRIIMSLAVVLVMTCPAGAIHGSTGDDGLIVPGQRIGSAHLGMSRASIEALNLVAACPVMAAYDGLDRVVRLETNTGGACGVSDEIQVGLGLGPVLLAFGEPNQVVEDALYPQATAIWLKYPGWGIAFRVLVMRNSSALIQTIAVFPGILR